MGACFDHPLGAVFLARREAGGWALILRMPNNLMAFRGTAVNLADLYRDRVALADFSPFSRSQIQPEVDLVRDALLALFNPRDRKEAAARALFASGGPLRLDPKAGR